MQEDALLQHMNRRFDAVAELIAQFAQRVDARFEALERVMNTRFEAVERRLDRLETRMSALELQMTGISKWADQTDHSLSRIAATQLAQQKAIDDLAGRVSRLEQRGQ